MSRKKNDKHFTVFGKMECVIAPVQPNGKIVMIKLRMKIQFQFPYNFYFSLHSTNLGVDCGVYVSMYCDFLVSGNEIPSSFPEGFIDKCRKFMTLAIMNQCSIKETLQGNFQSLDKSKVQSTSPSQGVKSPPDNQKSLETLQGNVQSTSPMTIDNIELLCNELIAVSKFQLSKEVSEKMIKIATNILTNNDVGNSDGDNIDCKTIKLNYYDVEIDQDNVLQKVTTRNWSYLQKDFSPIYILRIDTRRVNG
jgi:hypothetical protein